MAAGARAPAKSVGGAQATIFGFGFDVCFDIIPNVAFLATFCAFLVADVESRRAHHAMPFVFIFEVSFRISIFDSTSIFIVQVSVPP